MGRKVNKPESKAEAQAWVEAGNPCTFRYGWGWKGASSRPISTEEAREKLKRHHFGMGFYTMGWEEEDGQVVLNFNELSENDMY